MTAKPKRLLLCDVLGHDALFLLQPFSLKSVNGYREIFRKRVKGATSRLVHLEKFSLKFSSSSFAIRVNLLHP